MPRARTVARQSTITLHFGRKGSGKSFKAKRDIERSTADAIAIWDARSEWAGPTSRDPPRVDALLVRSLGTFLRIQSTRKRPLARVIVFQCRAAEFPRWCRWVLARGRMLAVVDELHLFAGPHDSPEKSGAFIELIRVSRHAQVDVLGMAQRPKSIHGDIREQADVFCSFACTEPTDLDYFSAKCSKEYAQGLAKLRPRCFKEFSF